MKVTKRQLQRIIRESFGGIMGHVHGDPSKPRFEDLAFAAVNRGDFKSAANSVMDSFMMDDPSPEDVENLESMLAGLRPGFKLDDLRRVVDSWRRSGARNNHSTAVGMHESMEELPPPGAGRKRPPTTDALILADTIEFAVHDGLQELGVDARQAEEIVEVLKERLDLLEEALNNGLYDYKKTIGQQ